MLLKGNDPFILNLLGALGVSTERMTRAAIYIEPKGVVRVEADYLAAGGQEGAAPAISRRLELARPAALEGLLSELEGGRIRALEISEGDLVVFRTPAKLDSHQRQYVADQLERVLGADHRTLILDDGAELVIVKAGDEVLDTGSL